MNSNPINIFNKDHVDYKEIFKPYLKKWKWFSFSLFIALVFGVLYIRYTTPEYAIMAKIHILEDQAATSELSAFRDLAMLDGMDATVEDEIQIMNSRSNMLEVVKELGLNTKISGKGNIHNTEIYKNPPIKVSFLIPDSLLFLTKDQFTIKIISETSFSYKNDLQDTPEKVYFFGNTITSDIGDFVLTPNRSDITSLVGNEYIVSINPIATVANKYQIKLQTAVSPLSNIISISLQDAVKQKGIDVINSIVNTYNRNAIEDKRIIADRTSDFINERINDIYGDLSTVDRTAEEFKSDRGITDVTAQSDINLNFSATSRQQLQEAQIQLSIASSMKDIVENQQGYQILPSNVGLSDISIVNTTARYNELVLERNRLLKSSNEKNPIIVNLDQQLNGLRTSLRSSLNSMVNNLNLQVNNLNKQLSSVNARIYAAPGNERALRDITRQQQTTEALYLYLLQKREESQITLASTSPKSKIIDAAHSVNDFPVSPKKPIVLLASMILGFLIPFGVIYVLTLLDNKVHNKFQLEKLVGDIPVLAEIPKIKKKEHNLVVKAGERTVLAESLRILRANLDYLIKTRSKSKRGNVIFVTSGAPSEGKTLVASNLTMIYSKANKKVLLLGADIRNPKLYKFYTGKKVDKLGKGTRNKDNKGLSDYLADESLEIRDITSTMLVYDQNVDVIFSGRIPPNPSELLMSNRVGELIDELRDWYDYIIVDTAPVMVVSDTLLISEYADHTLFVTRAHQTELRVLEFPLKLHKEGKIKGMSFIVNGVKDADLGYGGRYGYGYGKATKKWWKAG